MTKIHILSDSPKAKTGFGIAGENIPLGLKNLGHEVTYTGIQTSHIPEYFHGIKVYPLSSNFLEDAQFVTNLIDSNPDIVIYINDMYTDISPLAKIPMSLNKPTIIYCPVEGSRVPKRMVNDLNEIANNGGKVIAQCQYGYNEMKKNGVNVDRYIYHGFNPLIYKSNKNHTNSKYCYYGTESAKLCTDPNLLYEHVCHECNIGTDEQVNCLYYKEETISFLKFGNLFGTEETKKWEEVSDLPISKLPQKFERRFVYLFVGANHNIRKRIERLLTAYSLFTTNNRQLKDNTWLHLHTKPFSPTGLNLIDIATELGIEENISFSYGNQLSNNLSEEAMSIIYNSADCLVSATSSEGFSLPHLEAMACGVPCISPDCTSMTELIRNDKEQSKNRGLLAKIQSNFMIQDGSIRSLVDENDLAKCMKEMYSNNELREKFSKNAVRFAEQYTWDKIIPQWNSSIKEMKT